METVVLDGVTYIKASVVAKDFRYTPDYVGQLCRAKKVDARLVGRTWFVNPDSITSHKRTKHQRTETTSSSGIAKKTKPSRISVAPVIKSKTLKSLFANSNYSLRSPTGERKLRVSYELDDEALIPPITVKPSIAPKKIDINHADAKKIRIKSDNVKKNTDFRVGELPEVSLSGKLSIQGLAEAEEQPDEDVKIHETSIQHHTVKTVEPDNKPINIVKSPRLVSVLRRTTDSNPKIATKKSISSSQDKIIKNKSNLKNEKNRSSNDKETEKIKSTFVPAGVSVSTEESVSVVVLFSPLLATFVAIVCFVVLMSASTNINASLNSYDDRVVFQSANILDFLKN